MKTKRRQEGWLMIDNRNSPGVPDQVMHRVSPELPPGSGRGLLETATVSCSHCQKQVIIRPDRERERAYCRSCDHYICDECAVILRVTGVHRAFAQVIDDVQERAGKGLAVPIFNRNPTTWPSASSPSPPST